MANRVWVMSLLAASAAFSAVAGASHRDRDVTVEVVDSHGAVFQQIPIKRLLKGEARTSRAYLEAERDARYRIRITNSTGERVGVVVAVDGRNIISGAKSDLDNDEPMYVLSGWDTQEYSGWRANLSEVNEFYFTEWKDSYAEAFGDRSARGVIAVAVYREKESRRQYWREGAAEKDAPARAAAPPPASSQSADASANGEQLRKRADRSEAKAEAGTGYGDRRFEHATRVAFESESRASQQLFLKYEWRDTLCDRGVLSCSQDPPNRFWPDRSYGFAPPPPPR